MKKTFLILVLGLLLFNSSQGQDYNTGIGIRAGFGQGLTIKHFIKNNTALEGILVTEYGGFYATGLYEIHKLAFQTPRLNWYYGFGGHIGFGSFNDRHPLYKYEEHTPKIGIDGIIGLEYNFTEIPINIGIDYKPTFDLTGEFGLIFGEGALSIRYIF